jgi:8-oxo-dGTP pyrophosphatase MutT (NUDIX family)
MEMRVYYVPSFTGDFILHDHLEIRWVSIEELPLYDMPDPDRPIVEKLLATQKE